MDVLEAIHGRQSSDAVSQVPIERETIELLLSAAVQAPNHYRVRPWRFWVFTGRGRDRLGQVMAASFAERYPTAGQEAVDKTRALPLRAPVVVVAAADPPAEPKVLAIENVCAVAAACQNVLLAAHALGLRAKWRTGEWARDRHVKEYLRLSPDHTIVSFLYIGRPQDGVLPSVKRPSFEDRVMWMD